MIRCWMITILMGISIVMGVNVQNTTYTILVEGITDDGCLMRGTQTVTKR